MSYMKNTKSDRVKSNKVTNTVKKKKVIVFVYFELKSPRKLSQIQLLIPSQKATKSWKESSHQNLLNSFCGYLSRTCRDHLVTAVFVCSKTAQIFQRFLKGHDASICISNWVDLTGCIRQQLDPQDMKANCYDPEKLSFLLGQHITPGTEAGNMEKMLPGYKTEKLNNWSVPKAQYETAMISLDLADIVQKEEVMMIILR